MCEDTGLMAIELQEAGYLVVHPDDDLDTLSDAFDTVLQWFLKKLEVDLDVS